MLSGQHISIFCNSGTRATTWLIYFVACLGVYDYASTNACLGQENASDSFRSIDKQIDEFQSHFDDTNKLSGVLLIAKGDDVIFHKEYGKANYEFDVPNQLDTQIGIASITKQFTNIILTQLLMEKVLKTDDTVSKWIPEFPHGNEVTIELLARHRAGIPHRLTTSEEESMPLSTRDVVAKAGNHELAYQPGTSNSYSSAGYTVLARCMELATGKPFSQLLQERIFEPAGMTNSIDPDPGRMLHNCAYPYVPGRNELWPAPKKDLAYLSGAGSVFSTAEDLWKFVVAFRNGKLSVPFRGYAPDERLTLIGASNGYFAFVKIYPDEKLTTIWVGNTWGGCASVLLDSLPAILKNEHPIPVEHPEIIETDTSQFDSYSGTYESRVGATNQVRSLGGELWVADSIVLPIGEDRFWHQAMHCELLFVRDESKKVTAVELHRPDSVTKWPKLN